MKLAIMQPYFFPYLGYWQLINAVDRFIIYDDVNYIKNGWINRNRILINGAPAYLTAPLQRASPNRLICEIQLDQQTDWRARLAKSVMMTYQRAPCFSEVFPVIEGIISNVAENLSEYLASQIRILAEYLGIRTDIVGTSRHYGNNGLRGQSRVLDICRREGAAAYINAQGGQSLYKPEAFHKMDMELYFLVPRLQPYRQRAPGFVPNLSIIDVLMENGREGTRNQLDAYDLRTDTSIHE